jgi:hypothetical protein
MRTSTVCALCLSLASLLASAVPAAADEILLANGRRLEGTATFLDDGRVEIRAAFGTLVLPASRIARIENKISLEEAVATARARLDGRDAEGLYQLALWCQEKGATTLARRLFEETLAIDPQHAGTRRALGYRLAGGRWVTETEYHALRGEVQFRGAWVSAAERDRILAWETAQAVAEVERRRAAARAAEVAAAEARLVLATERAPESGFYAYDPYSYGVPGGSYVLGHPHRSPHFKSPRRPSDPPPTIDIPRPRPPTQRPVEHRRSGFKPQPGSR